MILRHLMYTKLLTVLTVLLFCTLQGMAQDSTSLADKIINSPDKVFGKVEDKTAKLDKKLTQQTEKYLNKLERQEKKLYRKLLKKDSAAAKELFGDIRERYKQLKDKASTKVNKITSQTNVYSSKLDSLGTAFNFIKENKLLNTAALNDKLEKSITNLTSLQGKLNSTEQIQRILRERRQQLKEQLQKFGMVKELKQYKRQVYYYQQQAREYREILENPDKLQRKLMDWAFKIPAFKDFFAKNSALAGLFAMPGQSSPPQAGGLGASFAGLQTRASLQQSLAARFGSGPNAQQVLQQNMQQAQSQLNQLKAKVNQLLPTGNNDAEMPDFKPNNQKSKSFLKRLEYGTNFQSQKANGYWPITSDVGLSVGYKPNDKSVIGIGASYKIGLGQSLNHIRFTQQGVGIRSFLDYKLKGSLSISGGYEMNYRTLFNSIPQLRELNAWQQSGLIGVSKVVSLKTKFFKKTKLQLLVDFLSYQQLPKTQPVLFRVDYNF
jgi:hypothetical protein